MEITPPHRRVAIGDAEQLEATSIILAWRNAEILLFLGSDNRNVLTLAMKVFAKKAAASVLNQETSKWIANRGSQVEGVFIRSGRNFRPDWMTRTSHEAIEQWSAQYGFKRIRLRPIWGKTMPDSHSLQIEEVTMPGRRVENANNPNLLFVEWNSGGVCFVRRRTELDPQCNFPNQDMTL